MATRFIGRDGSNNIVGSSRWPSPKFTEQIDDQDQEYLDWLNAPPPDNRPALPDAAGASIPALRAEVQGIIDALKTAGILQP